MQDNYIEFKQKRDLGSIITDTFKFLRHEWKHLFGSIIKIAGPALVVVIAAYMFYMHTTLGSFGDFSSPNTLDSFTLNTFISLFVLMFAAIAFYALLYGTIIHYIKSYVKNNGIVDDLEVKTGVRNRFWSLVGLSFIVAIISTVGLVMCVAPGIYVAIVLITTYSIHILEGRSISDSISYSFSLIKGEWWITFATILVMFMLYYFILMIFNIPQYIYLFIKMLTMTSQASPNPAEMFDWIYIALTTIAAIAQYMLHTVIVICSVFVYYNLNERKNFTGAMESIDAIGKE
jgi:hypothetical protein